MARASRSLAASDDPPDTAAEEEAPGSDLDLLANCIPDSEAERSLQTFSIRLGEASTGLTGEAVAEVHLARNPEYRSRGKPTLNRTTTWMDIS